MCQKRNSTKVELRNHRIIKVDDCMANMIANTHFNTLSCCCGHGKYPKTLIIKIDKKNIEFYSGKTIPRITRFYLKDKEGYYYIPELRSKSRRKIKMVSKKFKEFKDKLETKELLKELVKYLEKKGWRVSLIEEEGILKGDEFKKNSFRLSFKFIGRKALTRRRKVGEK